MPYNRTMLQVTRTIAIAEAELSESFVRAGGPGGQHVNRTESAVELRFDVARSPSLPEAVRERLLQKHDRRLTSDGVLVIQARRHRDQARNREDARQRLVNLIAAATRPPKKRIPTKPSKAARRRRMDDKSKRGQIKKARSRDWSGE